MPSSQRPLDGVRVLEFAPLFPGPYAGLVLSELGASVVKVEPPTGDPARTMPPFVEDSGGGAGAVFCALNRGKRSVRLDLKADEGDPVERFHALAEDARIVVDGYAAGVAERLGVGFDALAEGREDLAYVSVTGFGSEGQLAGEPGHDLTYQAWMGALVDGDPGLPNLPTADASSALWAALTAIAHLRVPGNHRLDTSLAGSLAPATLLQNASSLAGLDANPLTGGLPGYHVYACEEGDRLALGALEPAFWRNLARLLGDEELAAMGDPTDPGDPEGARRRLAERFRAEPREAWLSRLREAGVPCAPVRTTREALEKPITTAPGDPPGAVSREDLLGAPPLGEANEDLL